MKVQSLTIRGLKQIKRLLPLLACVHDVGTQRDRAGNRELFFDQTCRTQPLVLFQSHLEDPDCVLHLGGEQSGVVFKQPHAFYAGIDLHARSMFTHILDHAGATVFERDLPASPEAFLNAIAPFRDGLVVGVECMFAWYWLADLCEDEAIPLTLGHALYMKAIHGGKSKIGRTVYHRTRKREAFDAKRFFS
ncbi:MAG: hypothetical protein HYR84_14050 [Planctomycetes bacterium]|nr:hypothetical protein [Planctomycetota bacterium]